MYVYDDTECVCSVLRKAGIVPVDKAPFDVPEISTSYFRCSDEGSCLD